MLKPDILFAAWNRLEFTQRTFRFLLEHTDWDRAGNFVVYDDGSEPRTRLWLQDACAESPVPVHFRVSEKRWGSPVAIMADYLGGAPAEWFVKIDNDVAVPPGWLEALLGVAERNPQIDLLGFEAGMTIVPFYREGSVCAPRDWDGIHGFEPSSHIGGVGLMRTDAFNRRPKLRANGTYYGFTEWQHWVRSLVRGWITPDLPAPLLDRLPAEPFMSLSHRYEMLHWQRSWSTYDPDLMSWAYQWVLEKEAECVTA